MSSISEIEAMVRTPRTRYPFNVERSYASNVKKLIAELDDLALYEFDNVVEPLIATHRMIVDGQINDSAMDNIRKAIDKIKQLSLGAFSHIAIVKTVGKFTKGVSAVNKTNINSQLKVKGINPIETEPWIKPFLEAKVQENVSYISGIRDNYADKVEQAILRGVTSGQSTSEMREEILKHTKASVDKAEFIARDQTGTMLGQMNAERHKRAGIIAFRWSDSGDNKVRDSHALRDGQIFFYADNPLLPGDDYGCRCVAEPVDEFDSDFIEALEERNKPMAKQVETGYNYVNQEEYSELIETAGKATESEQEVIYDPVNGYIQTPTSFKINRAIRAGTIESKSNEWRETVSILDSLLRRNKLDKNILVERWEQGGMLKDLLIQNNAIDMKREDIQNFFNSGLGKYYNPSYMSTSMIPEKNVFQNRPVKLILSLPKGQQVFVTKNFMESELILPREMSYKITSFEFTGNIIEIKMEVG